MVVHVRTERLWSSERFTVPPHARARWLALAPAWDSGGGGRFIVPRRLVGFQSGDGFRGGDHGIQDFLFRTQPIIQCLPISLSGTSQ